MDWSSIPAALRAVIRSILIILNIIYSIGSYLWWTNVLRPLRWIKPELYHSIEGTLYRMQQENVAYWLWTGGYTGIVKFVIISLKL